MCLCTLIHSYGKQGFTECELLSKLISASLPICAQYILSEKESFSGAMQIFSTTLSGPTAYTRPWSLCWMWFQLNSIMFKSTLPLKWKKGLFCFVQQQMFGLEKYLCGNISHTLHLDMQIWVCVSDSQKHPALHMFVCLLMASSWESSHKEALLCSVLEVLFLQTTKRNVRI